MSRKIMFFFMLALVALVATAVSASVIVNEDGTGFVGKGDVQLVYGWNNKDLQDNAASVQFRMIAISETTWDCYNTKNENIQERTRTTTTQGLLSSVSRVRNQVTGFILSGFNGTPTSTTGGPPLNSCPSGFWVFVDGSTETTFVGGGLQVSVNGVDWFDL